MDGRRRDAVRDSYLHGLGLHVLRFSNMDVLGNMDGVIAMIVRHLETVLGKWETIFP